MSDESALQQLYVQIKEATDELLLWLNGVEAERNQIIARAAQTISDSHRQKKIKHLKHKIKQL